MDVPKTKRLIVRIGLVVLIGFLGVEAVQRVRRILTPLGESPNIQFPNAPISQSEMKLFLSCDFRLIKDMRALPEPA
jgi:hypothetical protein